MKFKEFFNTLKKRIVLIPLGTLAAIATIIGVIHQLQPDDNEFENLISDYVNISHYLNRYQVNDSLASDSIIIMLENIQDDIELYIKSISKINITPNSSENSENRLAIAKQNLLIIMDSNNIKQCCENNLMILILNADTIMQKEIESYISLEKLENSRLKGAVFTQYLSKQGSEINRYADAGNTKMMIKILEQIITSNELAESLSENKRLYVDIYDSINLMKKKYEQNKVI